MDDHGSLSAECFGKLPIAVAGHRNVTTVGTVSSPKSTMNDPSADFPKRNWPLIGGGIVIGCVLAAMAIGVVVMYVANFNLLEWVE
jgi:hypothetical protein